MAELEDLWDTGRPLGDAWGGAKPTGRILTKTAPQMPAVELEPDYPAAPTEPHPLDPTEWIFPASGQPTRTVALAQGALSGLTRRFGDELQGAALAPFTRGEDESFLDAYRRERDEARAAEAATKAAHPTLHGAAELGGTLANEAALAALTGGASATPAGQAATGAAEGLGGSEADLTTGDIWALGRAGADAAGGAVLSYGGAKAGEAVAPYLQKGAAALGERLNRFAADRALKASGAIQHNYKAMTLEQQRKLGEDMIRERLVRFGRSANYSQRAAGELREAAGEKMGGVLSTLDEATHNGFDWAAALGRMVDEVAKKPPQRQDLLKDSLEYLADVMARHEALGGGFAAANQLKSDMYDLLGKYVPDPGLRKGLANELNAILKSAIDDQVETAFGRVVGDVAQKSSPRLTAEARAEVERLAGEGIGQQWQEAKRLYGLGKQTQDLAKKGVDRIRGNRRISPTDYLAGMAASQSVDDLAKKGALGTTVALAHGLIRGRGSSMLAQPSLAASDALRSLTPEAAAEVASVLGADASRGLGEEAMRRFLERYASGQ